MKTYPFRPDWMKVARLPWVNLVASRWGFVMFWHFGPLRLWVTDRFVAIIWRQQSWSRSWE